MLLPLLGINLIMTFTACEFFDLEQTMEQIKLPIVNYLELTSSPPPPFRGGTLLQTQLEVIRQMRIHWLSLLHIEVFK